MTSGVLHMYMDQGGTGTGTDVRAILPDGTTGFIIFMPVGDVATKLCNVWSIRVNRCGRTYSMDKANMFDVKFTHRRLPWEDVVIPT